MILGLTVSLDLTFFNLPRIRKLHRQRPLKTIIHLHDFSSLIMPEEFDSLLYEDHSDPEEFQKELPSGWKSISFFIKSFSLPHQDFKILDLTPQDLIDNLNSAKNFLLDSGFQDNEIKLSIHSESLMEHNL